MRESNDHRPPPVNELVEMLESIATDLENAIELVRSRAQQLKESTNAH